MKIIHPWLNCGMSHFCINWFSSRTNRAFLKRTDTVDCSEIPNNHLGCKKPVKQRDKLSYQPQLVRRISGCHQQDRPWKIRKAEDLAPRFLHRALHCLHLGSVFLKQRLVFSGVPYKVAPVTRKIIGVKWFCFCRIISPSGKPIYRGYFTPLITIVGAQLVVLLIIHLH